MIDILNRLVDAVEQNLGDELDVDRLAAALGTTGYHARRMTVAAADVVGGEDLLTIAVRYGYGGPLRSQPHISFRLIGHATRVPLVHEGINPHIQRHITSLPVSEHARLKDFSNIEPRGLLQVGADVSPDAAEGSELTYLHGVAVGAGTDVPGDLDMLDVGPGAWVVFRTSGAHPAMLQEAYAASATEWFPSNPWRLRPGPSIVSVIEHAPDFSTASCELWFPIERA